MEAHFVGKVAVVISLAAATVAPREIFRIDDCLCFIAIRETPAIGACARGGAVGVEPSVLVAVCVVTVETHAVRRLEVQVFRHPELACDIL